jgi:hypothetical protein
MNARYATLFAAEAREQLAAVTAGVLALESASAEGPPARAADAGAADVRTGSRRRLPRRAHGEGDERDDGLRRRRARAPRHRVAARARAIG